LGNGAINTLLSEGNQTTCQIKVYIVIGGRMEKMKKAENSPGKNPLCKMNERYLNKTMTNR